MLHASEKFVVSEILARAVSRALETMAFLVAEPQQIKTDPPDRSILAYMEFTGNVSGKVELAAGEQTLQDATDNILGLIDNDSRSEEMRVDAIKELLNASCGILLPQLAQSPADEFDVTVPQAEIFDDAEQWRNFVSRPGVVILAVDDRPVAARMVISE